MKFSSDYFLTKRDKPYYSRLVKKVDVYKRIWEIDFLRGFSIILVVCYHLLYDLSAYVGTKRFLGWSTDLSTTAWIVAQHFFAGLFIVLSGTSSTLTRSNTRRGLRLLVVAMAVTVVTYVFDSSSAIWFGILHLLAVSILIFGAAFKNAKAITCTVWGVFVLGLGLVLSFLKKGMTIRFDWLLPFGFHSPGYSSFDYFPLIPWLGVFLIGAAMGRSIYAPRRSLIPRRLPQTFVNTAGRHSLLIYILHQPLILAVLYVLGLMKYR
ncbi:MAG: DUF1624 domain-containing protein [Candidatus Aminicenantes bacterium]|nr:DUF1624 domain-containing protein [Candidatus Aminicenantes bacterium]